MKSVLLILLAIGVASTMGAEEKKKDTLHDISDGLNKFSNNLLKTILANDKKNLVVSPLSVHVLLSMAAYGAQGKTFAEMKKSLGLPNDDTQGMQGFQDLTSYLNKLENVTLEVANSLYVSDKLSLKSEYKDLAKLYFESYASELNFAEVQESVQIINNWASEKTHQKIPSLIDEDFIDDATRMVLLNAVYFKGAWFEEFPKQNTQDEKFYINGKMEKKVPTMFIKKEFVYGELPDKEAKYIELPYKNENLKMVIVVPDKVDGLYDIVKNIEYFSEKNLAKSRQIYPVSLYLPKFKIESVIPMENPLQELGMKEMFSFNADFSKISDQRLSIAKVLQKAMIEVNEEGSEAAAATVAGVVLESATIYLNEKTLKVDRPFYYKIVDSAKDFVLFEGVVQDPKY